MTLQPLQRFDLDAAILFSDILTIPDAMGLGLYFSEGEGPRFKNPIRCSKDVENLAIPDPEQDLGYVMDTVRMLKHELTNKVPLIGFAGSPWTLACYMVEGAGSKDFQLIKTLLYDQPNVLHQLLDKLAQSVTAYLNAQIAAGAQTVMLFDSWGGVLTSKDYETFSLDYMQKIISGLTRQVADQRIPVIVFTKGGGLWLEKIATCGCDAIGIDWMTDIGQARKRLGPNIALQGNLDPTLLFANPQRIQQQVKHIIQAHGPTPGHVFNLGHGILPQTPPEHVQALIEAVHG